MVAAESPASAESPTASAATATIDGAARRQRIADSASPVLQPGEGLSILRLGVSAGSNSIQPTDPGGPNATPKYVWDGDDGGQVWLAKQTEAYGVSRLYADAWSALGHMKTDGDRNNGGSLCGLSGTRLQELSTTVKWSWVTFARH